MATELMEPTMAGEKPKTLSVKLHDDVIDSARVVAALRGEQMQDMLSDILRPILARMEQEAIARRVERAPGKAPARRGKARPKKPGQA